MPKPKLRDRYQFFTSTQVCEALGLSIEQLDRRLAQHILPQPTRVTRHGVRLFDKTWLEMARDIIEGSFEGQRQTAKASQESMP